MSATIIGVPAYLRRQLRHNRAMSAVTYEQFERALHDARALPDGPEAHGTLAGALCVSASYRLNDWLIEILPEKLPEAAAPDALRDVYQATRQALGSVDAGFALLLPDDESALHDRTAALGLWCQGFLYGLGSGAIPDPGSVSSQANEIMQDFSQITQVGVDESEDAETNEAAFAEVVEFVRVGVQLLFIELATERRDPQLEPQATMH